MFIKNIKIYVLWIGICLASCSQNDMNDLEPNVPATTASIDIAVNLCDFMADPICQNTAPLPSVNVLLFNTFVSQDENIILQEGATNSEGRILFDNLEPKTYYITTSYQSEIIKDSLTITQNASVSYLEILYLK